MIDKSKTYTTSDGLPVEIYRTDAGGSHPVHGAVLTGGCWDVRSWQADGVASYSSFNNLIEVKKKRTLDVWVNVYDDGRGNLVIGGGDITKADAERFAVRHRFACTHFVKEITEGEGL